jgi:hypothetical protein
MKRIYEVRENHIRNFVRKSFDDKYKISFDEIENFIKKMNETYEEAINFGDLELVKKIYYYLKDSDKLFKKIEDMKI